MPENGNFTDPHNHYTLTGKEFDENTGLVWFGARHYEPETGVWMGQDSYRGRLDEPMSLHRFGYVENNPINYIDEYGYSKKDIKKIKKNFKKTVHKMNRTGKRNPGSGFVSGEWNNISSWVTGYYGCGEQANELLMKLLGKKYDDKWSFNLAYSKAGLHLFVVAKSNNSSNPSLKLDPWRNTIEQISNQKTTDLMHQSEEQYKGAFFSNIFE